MLPQALELGSLPIAAGGFAVGFAAVYGFDLSERKGIYRLNHTMMLCIQDIFYGARLAGNRSYRRESKAKVHGRNLNNRGSDTGTDEAIAHRRAGPKAAAAMAANHLERSLEARI